MAVFFERGTICITVEISHFHSHLKSQLRFIHSFVHSIIHNCKQHLNFIKDGRIKEREREEVVLNIVIDCGDGIVFKRKKKNYCVIFAFGIH